MLIDRRRLLLWISAFIGQGLSAAALAQDWPSRAIVILVPFPAGGSADLSARLLAEDLKAVFGQPVIVENKPGAGGNLARRPKPRGRNLTAIHYSLAPTALRPLIKVSIGSFLSIRRPTLQPLRWCGQRRICLLFIHPYRLDRLRSLLLTHAPIQAC